MAAAKARGRILVFNDTQEILDLFREILELEGYEDHLYSHTPQELTEIERLTPDLVIIDVIFGSEKLGWQLLDKMKMKRTTANIPVVVCTVDHRGIQDREGYLHAMGVEVVLKPFDLDIFLATIAEALAHPSRQQDNAAADT